MMRVVLLSLLVLLGATLPSFAGTSMSEMHQQMHGSSPMSEADKDFSRSMTSMHDAMMGVKPSGDADIDFARLMIPHHEGAIEMAKIVLKYGKDPENKKLADDIIKAQESEVAIMKAWLAKQK